MSTSWNSWAAWLADLPPARNTLDALLRAAGRRHVARFDAADPVRAQTRALLGLVNRARRSRFGLDHDFRRVRSLADFRRLVPVRGPGELGRLVGPLPATTPALRAAWRAAYFTAFALAVRARPQARLLAGPALVADGVPSSVCGPRALERLPWPIRPFGRAACGPDRHGNDDPAAVLAERHARDEVTALVGPADRLLELIDRARRTRAVASVDRVWPALQFVLWTRPADSGAAAALLDGLPSGVLALELITQLNVPIGVEDPCSAGNIRLLTDHGVHFEFLPVARAAGLGADGLDAQRLALDQIEAGGRYELALSAPGGLWACRSGLVVRFDHAGVPVVTVEGPQAASQAGTSVTAASGAA